MKPACFILALALSLLIFSCGENKEDNKEAGNKISNNNSSGKDYRLQEYKLEQQKEQALERFPCDTISLKEFVLSHYAPGTYLVDFDKTLTFDIQRSAVIYPSNYPGYIFGIIAKSKSGERYIEPKNIVGYNESFIDLDSTKLGTAFFYLTLFQCDNNRFKIVWEAIIPSHGGFNTFSLEKWKYNKTPYIRVNFHLLRV